MSGYTVFARYYDVLTKNVDCGARAGYFDRLIQRYRPDAQLLLDLACGTGSLSVELTRLGYDVTGVDASADMLSFALNKNAALDRPVLYLHQPMERLDLYGTVDVTVCALDSINHLPDEAALTRVMEKVSLFTNPGGLFLFDVNTRYKHREVLGNNSFVYETPEVFCVWQNEYTEKDGRVDIRLDFFEPETGKTYRRSTEHFCERVFEPELLREMLACCGFRVLEVFEQDSMRPPSKQAQRLVFVAEKEK